MNAPLLPDDDIRMDAYYYGFSKTGERSVDVLLSAIACAGKAFHSTEDWLSDCRTYEECHRGKTPVEWIQNAANDLAKEIKERRAPISVSDEVVEQMCAAHWESMKPTRAWDLIPEEWAVPRRKAMRAAIRAMREGK